MDQCNILEYQGSKAELTPDLITDIRHFPVTRTLLQNPLQIIAMAGNLMGLAKVIPALVRTL